MWDKEAFASGSLCVVGNINRDIKTAPIHASPNLFQDGETAIDGVIETIGGGGANSACIAAALGGRVAFVGKVGSDGLGRRLERTLTYHRIKTFLAASAIEPTGTSIGLSFQSGHRHFLSCLPASRSLTFADIDLGAMTGCDHLLRADIWFSDQMLYEGNRELFKAARARGLRTSIDLNWDPHWGVASPDDLNARKAAVRECLPWVDLAHGNVRELLEFSSAENLDAALARLCDWGVGGIVVHLGEKGAGFFQNGILVVEPPVPAKTLVNTTGTGDTLSACMMLLQNSRIPTRDQLRLANSVVSEFIEGRLQLIPKLVD